MSMEKLRQIAAELPSPLLRLMEEIRDAIAHDRFLDFRREFYERYDMTRNF